MRVAIFTNTYHPTLNGVANCVDAYRRGLEARGHDAFIFAPCPNGYDSSLDSDRVFRFPATPFPGDWDYDIAFPYSRSVLKTLKNVDFDLVHTQHPVWVGAWGQWFAQWAGIPLVTTIHTEYELYADLVPLPGQLVNAYLKARVTRYCNRCDLVTTPVQSARRRLRSQGIVAPIEILHNPIDLSALPRPDPDEVRERHEIDEDEFVIGFVGRLAPEKQLDIVLEATAMVVSKLQTCRFLMVGDGAEFKDLQAKAHDLGIADRVVFVGAVEHSEVPHYQAALDVFVTASMSETQPLSYTEAMAMGTPVVALDSPGAQDMIDHEHNGLLSPPDEGAAGLADQILRLHEQPPLREAIISNAGEWVWRYDVSAVTERLLEVYDQAARSHAQKQ